MQSPTLLIADSGATSTDWAILQSGKAIHHFKTEGISPVFMTQKEIRQVVTKEVLPATHPYTVNAVRFYGSGCNAERATIVKEALQHSYTTADITVHSDLIAATHALLGNTPGIAAIIGTGSNSCQWDGAKIIHQVPPLGFILGDEGSGAALGKKLLSDALKNQLPPQLKEQLFKQYNLTQDSIIENVYRQPFPSRYLASFVPFMLTNIHYQEISNIVQQSFQEFIQRNIQQYDTNKYKVNFVGSVAHHFAEQLTAAAEKENIEIGKIIQSPISGLIDYYTTTWQSL